MPSNVGVRMPRRVDGEEWNFCSLLLLKNITWEYLYTQGAEGVQERARDSSFPGEWITVHSRVHNDTVRHKVTEAQGTKERLSSEGHPERLPEGKAGIWALKGQVRLSRKGTQGGNSKSKGSEAGKYRPKGSKHQLCGVKACGGILRLCRVEREPGASSAVTVTRALLTLLFLPVSQGSPGGHTSTKNQSQQDLAQGSK